MTTFTPDTGNTLFKLAADLVNQSSRNIFLTGKAGTGKTTFLKYIRETCSKQMAVVAPTGVAAINAGGVTIHSFLQLPFSPFIPETRKFSQNEEIINRQNLVSRLRFSAEKRKVLQQLELLIIDEVSMVRSDIMDAMDTVLRFVRKRPLEKFGGIQVLFIGDMFQLPPVIKEEEWKILSEYYSSPFFFDSHVIKEDPPLYIEFEKIYRQSEEKFIRLLNQVRNNELDPEGMKILESRFSPGFRHEKKDGYIILTTHNESARKINSAELNMLDSPLGRFEARMEGDFPENTYPADEILNLKTGAQVMFIKNDTSERGKRYFNGKIGIVKKLEQDKIIVQCPASDDDGYSGEIEVTREKWENIRYSINKSSQTVEEEVLGSFTQFPLRLAWAITIHKSQGLTFDKAIIDAGDAFAPGQVYVALSRCTNLEGMVLKSRLRTYSLFTDPRIVLFSEQSASPGKLQSELEAARKQYQEQLWMAAFDFSEGVNKGRDLKKFLEESSSSFNPETGPWAEQWMGKLNAIQDTGRKFRLWLKEQFQSPEAPGIIAAILERMKKASGHFEKELEEVITSLHRSPAVTDSRQQAKEFNERLKDLFSSLAERKFLLEGFGTEIDPESWHRRKKDFVLPPFSVNAYAGASPSRTESPHPVLYQQLKKFRDSLCLRNNLPIYLVAGSQTLVEMARYLPQSLTELRKISGFGDVKLEQYGQSFLNIILDYCRERNLQSLVHEKSPKRERKPRVGAAKKKGESHAETLRLYREGLSAASIARERNLALSTIEGHFARLVHSGQIQVEKLISPEKQELIEEALKGFEGGTITTIKQNLGDRVSFGEIRLVIAALGIGQDKSPD